MFIWYRTTEIWAIFWVKKKVDRKLISKLALPATIEEIHSVFKIANFLLTFPKLLFSRLHSLLKSIIFFLKVNIKELLNGLKKF